MIPKRFFLLLDLAIIMAAFFGSYLFLPRLHPLITAIERYRPNWASFFAIQVDWTGAPPSPGEWLWVLLIVSVVTLVLNDMMGAYRAPLRVTRLRMITACMVAPIIGLSVATLVQYAVRSAGISRLLLFLAVLFCEAGLISARLILRVYFKSRLRRGFYAKNVVLLGPTSAIDWVAKFFAAELPIDEYAVAGYLKVAENQVEAAGLKCLGQASDLGDLLIHRPIHEVVAVQPATSSDWLIKAIQDCDYFRIPLYIVPEALLARELSDLRYVFHDSPLRLPAVALTPHQINSEALFLKRLFDIIVSATLLVLLSPLFLLIAIAIKLSTPRLSVLYPWRVVGLKGQEFTGYKFTTMSADADARKSDLLAKNEMSGPVFKIKDDPRITRLGRFLRKYSLNELPQLWSVLTGHMSLVGPRPAFPHELARYELWHKRKLSVQPGITCLWQIRGRNKITNFDDWVRMDLEYIHHWSLWLDLRILFRTAWIVVAGTGS
jgi:exopolysaccharide biosynthesis polyprenyl glycosylphosphotransferase